MIFIRYWFIFDRFQLIELNIQTLKIWSIYHDFLNLYNKPTHTLAQTTVNLNADNLKSAFENKILDIKKSV